MYTQILTYTDEAMGAWELGQEWVHTQDTTILYVGGNNLILLCLYTGNGVALMNSHFGHGSGPVQLGSVQCIGNENSFLDCPHNSVSHCTSYDNAGVVCPSEIAIMYYKESRQFY